jgi:hypothetical protein
MEGFFVKHRIKAGHPFIDIILVPILERKLSSLSDI